MTPALWIILISIVVLIIISAFFSGSETSLTAASRARMHQREKKGDKRARTVNILTKSRERLIGSILLGNNLVNILASSLATSAFIAFFGEPGVAYATLIMTFVVLIFAEVLPKTWALQNPDKFALAVAPVLRPIIVIFHPFVVAIEWIVSKLLWMFGVRTDQIDNLSAQDELRGAVDLLHLEGSVIKDDRDRLDGLLDLEELEISDIMVHRTSMQMLNADNSSDVLVQKILDSPFTRIPVWKGEKDNIVGVIHAKDVLRTLASIDGDRTLFDIMAVATPPWFIPESTNLKDQLNAFLKRRTHFAIVIDEYGEVMGLVTLEDILEEIVGEIADEHDVNIQGLQTFPDGSISVEGTVPIRDLNRAMDWQLPEEEATTIAGLVIHEARQIPEPGQAFTFHNFRFRVIRRHRNQITALRVTPLGPQS